MNRVSKKYFFGRGLAFGIVGKIAIGYEDILQVITFVCLILITAFVAKRNPINQKEYIFGLMALLINTTLIFLSLRRGNIGAYLIGVGLIWFFVNLRKKVTMLLIVGIAIFIGSLFLFVTGHSNVLDKILLRIDSINIFKYHDDAGSKLTSSMGHLSEIQNGWFNVKDHIFLGKGFTSDITKVYGWKDEFTMVHNELLFYWIRMGIAGVFIFFCMYLIPLRYCYIQLRKVDTGWKWLFLGIMSFILGRFIIQITIAPPISISPTKCYIYFIILGIIMNPFFLKSSKA